MTGNNQHLFTKGNLCLINLIDFWDEFTGSVDMVDSVYFDFSKALNPISHGVFVGLLWSR